MNVLQKEDGEEGIQRVARKTVRFSPHTQEHSAEQTNDYVKLLAPQNRLRISQSVQEKTRAEAAGRHWSRRTARKKSCKENQYRKIVWHTAKKTCTSNGQGGCGAERERGTRQMKMMMMVMMGRIIGTLFVCVCVFRGWMMLAAVFNAAAAAALMSRSSPRPRRILQTYGSSLLYHHQRVDCCSRQGSRYRARARGLSDRCLALEWIRIQKVSRPTSAV